MRDSKEKFEAAGIQVIGVSMDKPEDQKSFKDGNELPFTLIADTEGKLVEAFGVKLLRPGLCARVSVLVVDGKIAWRTEKIAPPKHAEEVLSAFGKL